MKMKIVQFENGKYGVLLKYFLQGKRDWLDRDGYGHTSWRPSVERCFDTVLEAQQAIEKYVEHIRVYKDKGKFVKTVKL